MSELLFIDFESYYDTEKGYTLNSKAKNHVSTLEYIKSPIFKTQGMSYRWGSSQNRAKWISGHDAVKAFLATVDWADTIIVAHNVKFDGAILHWIYGHDPVEYRDTLSMARAVLGYVLRSHSLAKVAEYYGLPPKGFLYTDGKATLTAQEDEELGLYCNHDTDLCHDIYYRLAKDFPAGQFNAMDWTMRAFIQPKLMLDGPKLIDIHATEKARREKIFEEIGIDKDIFSSNKQFAELLTIRGFEVPMKKNKNGDMIPALAVGDEGFRALMETDNDELHDLVEARMAAKSCLLETRSEKFLKLSQFDSFPFDVQFSGASQTHRYSGGSGAGGNPQNLPARGIGAALRAAVTVPAGYKMPVADFSTIELRIAAWLARDKNLIEAILSGDPYSAFSSRIYGRTITKADKLERQFGKCCVLGLDYAMGHKKFRYQAKLQAGVLLSEEEAKRIVTLFRTTYPGIPELWSTLDTVIGLMARGVCISVPGVPFLQVQHEAIVLPSGLKLKFPNLRVEEGERNYVYDGYRSKSKKLETIPIYGGKLLENICQALAGDICKEAIKRATSWGVPCLGQVHDEILAIAPEKDAENAALILRKAMEQPLSWWPAIRLKAEVGVGSNWLEAKGAAK